MPHKKRTHDHTHQLKKQGPIWKCANPTCTYFVYFKQEYVILGKQSICWACGKAFPMDEDAMEMEFPNCALCRNPELVPVQEAMDKVQEDFPMNTTLSHEEMRKKLIAMGVLHE